MLSGRTTNDEEMTYQCLTNGVIGIDSEGRDKTIRGILLQPNRKAKIHVCYTQRVRLICGDLLIIEIAQTY